MNGLLELELWRIIDQGNDKIGGGYSDGGRGCVPQPQCPAKRIAHGHVAWPWQLIESHVGETFLLYFHTTVSYGCVASRGMGTAYGTPVCLAVWFQKSCV
ncbi:hypothetical protein GOBAR_AA26800 [Gossypium barbadense]|uniref:Uncharacterized protein n=1 Tax=Gossypium barbadense TaxID=3634 RepID=A0A2P5WS06_GOSBA|nr:hypothetical protein GOBAR_AA26800 [Gossypium barbadense]